MPRPRSSGTARLLAAARRKSPPGFSGGGGGGPLFQDAYRARRAPTQSELAEAFKSICYACAHLNAGGLTRTPKRLYAATKSGQARPKCAVRGHRKTAADRARLRWMSKTHGYQHYFKAVEEVDEVLEHPLLQALAHPNPDFDEHGLFTHAVLSLDMLGAIFWEPEADGQPAKGVPDSFWPLLSQFVVPYRTPSGSQVESYSYFGQRYEPTQLVRCRFVGLRDPYGVGYGPAQAAFEYVGLGDQFVSVQENLLGQGFRPSAVISLKDGTMPMGRDERRRFEADVNSKWSGRSAGRVFVADGALDVKPLMFPPSDLAALQISDNALQRVANCFGIPLSLLKTEDVNLANAEAGHRQHAELGVQPRCVMLASAFTRWVHGHGGEIRKAYSRDPGWDRLFLAFDNPVVEDLERRAKIVDMQLKNGERVINEVRLEDGYDRVPWGDEPWMSNTLVQPSVAAEDREHSRTLAEQIANRPAEPEPEETDEAEADDDAPAPADVEGLGEEAEEKPEPEPEGDDEKALCDEARSVLKLLRERLGA
jgi:phage portal protein BeeE